MLVLTRKYGQAFWIGDDVKVTVLRGKGMQVRLAIDAPKEVVVLREELRSDQKPEASDAT